MTCTKVSREITHVIDTPEDQMKKMGWTWNRLDMHDLACDLLRETQVEEELQHE